MIDTAAKLRAIFYSSALVGPVIYGLSPNAVLCVNYLPTILLKLAAIAIFILVATEYASSYFNTENDLLSAFEDYSQIYSVEADENINSSLGLLFNIDNEPGNVIVNENISTVLNGKNYSITDVDAFCKNGESFSGLVITAPIELSSRHIIAAGKQNSMSGINIKEFVFKKTKGKLAIFNEKGCQSDEIPDEILKILGDLYNDTDAESINCSIQNNLLQIAIKTRKSYKEAAKPLFASMCNLSLRNIDKGVINERIKAREKVRETKKLK